jgi:pimeloyl-ACP methyl ester carboxylesterase
VGDPDMRRPRRIARPDVVLYGEEVGCGPSLLLLHAGRERRQVWRPVVDVLTEFRCVAYDQRGHGDSQGSRRTFAPYADDVAAMLAAEPPGCVVVGASLGGLAAVAALADPAVRARVAGLVLVDVVPDLEPDHVRRFLAASGLRDSDTGLVDDVFATVPLLRQAIARFDRPVHLVRGGTESPVTDDYVDRLLRLAPRATVSSVRDSGHLVARDQPVALAETIAAVVAEWPALALLRDLGADRVEHPGGNLLDHLRRVRDLVAAWGGDQRVCLAALCHATYGTDGFAHSLLPLDQRDRLRAAIGEAAEELVYRYAACDRTTTYGRLGEVPLPLTDRFTGDVVTTAAADFGLLTIANELDVARSAPLTSETRHQLRALVAALAVHAPDVAAEALADEALR